MHIVRRPEYLAWLKRWQGKKIIKVISGVRRCGKSTLLKLFSEDLRKDGVRSENIIYINLEDLENETLTNYKELHDYIISKLDSDALNYIFVDEIQLVCHFEKAVDSLLLRDNCDIYITGSNAYLLSSDLATLLTGRYVELKMLPLSFKEYYSGISEIFTKEKVDELQAFELYRAIGSFPYLINLIQDKTTALEYLQDLYNSILFKDVVARLKITEIFLLERIGKLLASCVGSLISPNKIAQTLTSGGKKVDNKTVDKYLDGLCASQLFYEAFRWDIKGRKVLSRQSKFYAVDLGLRNTLVLPSSQDVGHTIENIVFLELLRRGAKVFVGTLPNSEIDFVAQFAESTEYYQVCTTLLDEKTKKREIDAFFQINDGFTRTVLTLDRIGLGVTEDGVRIVNLIDWLLRK